MEDLKKRIYNFINLHPNENYKIQYVKEMGNEDVKIIFNKYIAPIVNFDETKKTRIFNKLEKSSKKTYKESNKNSRSWYRICKELAKVLYVDSINEIDINNSVDALVRLNLWMNATTNTLPEYKEIASMIWDIISKDKVNFRGTYYL